MIILCSKSSFEYVGIVNSLPKCRSSILSKINCPSKPVKGQLGHPIGGVYFRWQSQDIFIVNALIYPLNQDQLQLSQIPDDVQYLDAGAVASCDVCARKNFVYFRYLLCPPTTYWRTVNCQKAHFPHQQSTWNSQNIYLEYNWSPSCFNMMHCSKIIHPLYLAIFYFVVYIKVTLVFDKSWLWLISSTSKKEIVWCQDGNVDMGLICVNHRVT